MSSPKKHVRTKSKGKKTTKVAHRLPTGSSAAGKRSHSKGRKKTSSAGAKTTAGTGKAVGRRKSATKAAAQRRRSRSRPKKGTGKTKKTVKGQVPHYAQPHKSHVVKHKKNITDVYDIKEKLGKGNFAVVKRCVHKATGEQYAVKIIKKHKMDKEEIKTLHAEVDILHKVDHKFCVKLFAIFDQPHHLYLVMDYLRGGELFDRIVEKEHFTEHMAAEVVEDVAEALCYLHKRGIVHRDLKPENLIYFTRSDDSPVKITDFGLAKFLKDPHGLMRAACGTPGYVAPEVLAGKGYDYHVDLWSLGVILYIMLCGYPPFYADDDEELFKQIQTADYEFPEEDWNHVSDDAIDLVKSLMCLDPKKRLTAPQVLKHKWVVSDQLSRKPFPASHHRRLKRTQLRRQLRQAIELVIAVNRFKMHLKAFAAETEKRLGKHK